MKLERVNEHLKEKLKDPYFKELYELEEQKLNIVKKIIEYRIKHNITQEELAKRANVTQQYISKIENGEFSNITTLEKILLYIGYTVQMNVIPLKEKIRTRIARSLHSRRYLQAV